MNTLHRNALKVCLLNLMLATVAALSSCMPVKEYQKNRINDSEMSLSNRKVEKNELNFQSYREGSSGANGGKTGGGCGCN
jgi:Domain of unknown function (DUF4266)